MLTNKEKEWNAMADSNHQTRCFIPGDVGYPPGRDAVGVTPLGAYPLGQQPDKANQGFGDIRKAPESVRGSVLTEANTIVNGARANVYGGPEDNFKRIADLWSAYLNGQAIATTDVANMLALLKIARLKNSPDHRDSWVDIAGYAACGAECGLK